MSVTPAMQTNVYGLSRWLMEVYGLKWRAAVREVTLPGPEPAAPTPVDLSRFETMEGST